MEIRQLPSWLLKLHFCFLPFHVLQANEMSDVLSRWVKHMVCLYQFDCNYNEPDKNT